MGEMTTFDKLLQENPLFQDFWEQVIADLRVRAEAESWTKGKAEGKREVIQRVLESRFGLLSEEMLAALQAADLPRLDHIAKYAGIDSLGQLRVRLGLPTS